MITNSLTTSSSRVFLGVRRRWWRRASTMTARIPTIPPSSRRVSTNKRRVQGRRRLGRQTSSCRDHALSKGGRKATDTFAQPPASAIITSVASRRIWTTWESMLPVTVVVRRWVRNVTAWRIRAVIATVISSMEWGRLYPIGLRRWCLTSIPRRGRRVSKRLNTVRVKSKVIEVWNLLINTFGQHDKKSTSN